MLIVEVLLRGLLMSSMACRQLGGWCSFYDFVGRIQLVMTVLSFEDNTVARKGEQVVQVLVQSLQLPQTNFGMASLSLLLTQSVLLL